MNFVILRLLLFGVIYLFLGIVFWFFREPFGKYIDKIFSFPYLREGGKYKYTNVYEDLSSEGYIINMFVLIFLLSLSVLIAFEFSLVSVAIFLPIFLPVCLILLRINIFSEDNILTETEIGYFPVFSYILSFIASIGFFMLFPAFFGADDPLYFFIIVFILASAGVIVPMIPDQINKLLPYDIRSTKGQKLLVAITLVLVISLWVFVFAYFIVTGASFYELLPVRFGGG